jgi:glyoxylase-like metal-dependent hydrolase (beta-lactamase superfamily II)
MANVPYRIYAVRYAHRQCTTSECFYGDYHASPMAMDYFVWALTNGTETVVVDLGFTEAVGTRRGRQFLRCPGKGLAELGVDCTSVQHVILSHFHYDHVGNYALFPQPPNPALERSAQQRRCWVPAARRRPLSFKVRRPPINGR